jgi:hypothetical protein
VICFTNAEASFNEYALLPSTFVAATFLFLLMNAIVVVFKIQSGGPEEC